jgi:hypothetical protein
MPKKYFLFLIFISFYFLNSCSFGSTTDNWNWLIEYSWNGFTFSIPSNWNIITDVNNILPKPNHWNIELAITSKEEKLGFSNNLLVLSSDLTKTISSKDFSLWNTVWSENDYIEYKKLETKDFNFDDKEAGYLHIFEWKYNSNTPRLKFLQTSHVCDKKVYSITIALSVDNIDTTKYEKILNTFSCK